MKGKKVSPTLNEIKIAAKLNQSKANIFLESRAYIRKSLGFLFNLNPLKIPLQSKPGQPPKLPDMMGNLSISHSQDALIIIWHIHSIGIDLERVDRKFNYKSLHEKYFQDDSKDNFSTLNKLNVLKQWSGVEAAIKWDKGKISNDLTHWKYIKNKKYLFHDKKNITLKLSQFIFNEWIISIAYKEKEINYFSEIICANI
tara:strand:+ start:2496 stop:3092 length:597 start_codon:yes stop_codon:yes gene_type:complete